MDVEKLKSAFFPTLAAVFAVMVMCLIPSPTWRMSVGLMILVVMPSVLALDAFRWPAILARSLRIVDGPLWLAPLVAFVPAMTVTTLITINSWLDTHLEAGYVAAGRDTALDVGSAPLDLGPFDEIWNESDLTDALVSKLEKMVEEWVKTVDVARIKELAGELIDDEDAAEDDPEASEADEVEANSDADDAPADDAGVPKEDDLDRVITSLTKQLREQGSLTGNAIPGLTGDEAALLLISQLGPVGQNGPSALKHSQDVGSTVDLLVLLAFRQRVLRPAEKLGIAFGEEQTLDLQKLIQQDSISTYDMRAEQLKSYEDRSDAGDSRGDSNILLGPRLPLNSEQAKAVRETVEKLDAATSRLRSSVEKLKTSLNERTQVWLLVDSMPALRARLLFNGSVQTITIVFFWAGIFLICRAISKLDRDSQSFIEQYSRFAENIERSESRHSDAERDDEEESATTVVQPEITRLEADYHRLDDQVQHVLEELRRLTIDSLEQRSEPMVRLRTVPVDKKDEVKGERLTDDEAVRRLERYRRRHSAEVCGLIENIVSVLRASASSREFSQIPNEKDSVRDRMRDETDNSLEYCRFIVWLLPSIGFVGTILGISRALMQSDRMVSAPPEQTAQEVSKVTEYLGLAFDTTLVALVLSIVIVMLVHSVQYMSERNISRVRMFLDRHLIDRLRSWPELVSEEEDDE